LQLLEDISPEIEQAAMVDGYPWWRIFWRILPWLPGITFSLLAIFAWQLYVPIDPGCRQVTVTVGTGLYLVAQAFFNRWR
jgi:multiple sugar transport system permease protein